MDWYTARLLVAAACVVVLAIGLAWRHGVLVGALVVIAAAGAWLAAPHWCMWEGFEDGPLPIECRPYYTLDIEPTPPPATFEADTIPAPPTTRSP